MNYDNFASIYNDLCESCDYQTTAKKGELLYAKVEYLTAEKFKYACEKFVELMPEHKPTISIFLRFLNLDCRSEALAKQDANRVFNFINEHLHRDVDLCFSDLHALYAFDVTWGSVIAWANSSADDLSYERNRFVDAYLQSKSVIKDAIDCSKFYLRGDTSVEYRKVLLVGDEQKAQALAVQTLGTDLFFDAYKNNDKEIIKRIQEQHKALTRQDTNKVIDQFLAIKGTK